MPVGHTTHNYLPHILAGACSDRGYRKSRSEQPNVKLLLCVVQARFPRPPLVVPQLPVKPQYSTPYKQPCSAQSTYKSVAELQPALQLIASLARPTLCPDYRTQTPWLSKLWLALCAVLCASTAFTSEFSPFLRSAIRWSAR